MKKTRSAIRIPMPLRYLINLVLILALWFVLYTLIQNGTITNYWSGILITVGINIILATSLNIATGYLGLTIDERLADGYYYSKTIRLLKKLLENPELLETPANQEVEY